MVTPVAKIADRALAEIETRPELKKKIHDLSVNQDELFSYFITKVKENAFLEVSYILNQLFQDAVTRANFGNRADVDGNTAYHMAAQLGYKEIVVILNDKRPFKGVKKFFLYSTQNTKMQTPLDLACLAGRLNECFQEIWNRATLNNHNPMPSLKSACEGGNSEIVKLFLKHANFNADDPETARVIRAARSLKYGTALSDLFFRKQYPNSALETALIDGNDALLKEYIEEVNVEINAINASGYLLIDYIFTDKEKTEACTLEMLKILLAKGVDLSAKNGRKEYPLDEILAKTFRRNWNQLFSLVLENLKTIEYKYILYRIAKQGTIASLNIFLTFCEKRGKNPLQLLQQTYNKKPLLLHAIAANKQEMAFAFLDRGVPVSSHDSHGTSALHHSMALNDPDFTLKLLQRPGISVGALDTFQESCLHEIAREGADELIDLFLTYPELDVNKQNYEGDTPLLLCLKKIKEFDDFIHLDGSEEMDSDEVDYLGKEDDQDKIKSFTQIIHKLLEHGAEIDSENAAGETALAIAETLHHPTLHNTLAKCRDLLNRKRAIESIKEEIEKLEDKNLQLFHNNFQSIQAVEVCQNFLQQHIALAAQPIDEVDQAPVVQILSRILESGYVDYLLVCLFEIVFQVMQPEYENVIQSRFSSSLEVDDARYYYTFLSIGENFQIYRLTRQDQIPIQNYLITTLVYESIRHAFTEEACQLPHRLLSKLDAKFKGYSLDHYKAELRAIESNDYYGENLSDDSDSEEEKVFQKKPSREKHLLSEYARTLFKRVNLNYILTAKGELRKRDEKSERNNHPELQKIHKSRELSDEEAKDLERLNFLALTGNLNADTIKAIHTKFCVAQYRGIAYRTDQFNQQQRRVHRKKYEVRLPLVSSAANASVEQAEFLQTQMLLLKKSGSVRTSFTGESYTFNNALEALQDFYTKQYTAFHQCLKSFADKFINPTQDVIIDTLIDVMLLNIQSRYNPFVSTSDTPDHALRYAYGRKFYPEYKDLRMRPRWQSSGKAERPHSGKVYISLHEPLELIEATHHVPSLNQAADIFIDNEILPERETSFFAYIPSDRVVSQHIAKFPSFDKEYKETYLSKYGLNKELFDIFKKAILSSKPHTEEHKQIKNLLTMHLINYQEVTLVEEARIAAENEGKILLYRNEFGGFSEKLPFQPIAQKKEIGKSKNPEKQQALNQMHEIANAKRQKRKRDSASEADEGEQKKARTERFLQNLVDNFQIKCHAGTWSLKDILSRYLEFDESTPSNLEKTEFLKQVASDYEVTIYLHDLEVASEPVTYGTEGEKIHLYHFGRNQFAELISRKPS